ncbi:hypothetical protein BC832DRAFT_540321 [Gaertneriomyces semiglobifer]|nr:hypothetical protein BC832DRAFT_540321 [Gaertneriomyces semiglobifer]
MDRESIKGILEANLNATSVEIKKRAKYLLAILNEGLLDDLYNVNVQDLAKRLFDRTQDPRKGRNSTMENVVKSHLGYVRTLLSTDIPGFKDDEVRQQYVMKIRSYQDSFAPKHRKEGKFSNKEKEALDNAAVDIETFEKLFETVKTLTEDMLQMLQNNVSLDEEQLLNLQLVIILNLLLNEPNVRLSPYAKLKFDGNCLDDNIIVFEGHEMGKIVLIFNTVKTVGVPIILSVSNEPLKKMMHAYFDRYRKDHKDHGYLFQKKTKRPFSADELQKGINQLLRKHFADGLTSRLIRVIETITSYEADKKFSYRELDMMSFARNHSIKEGHLYNRTERSNV